MSNFRLFRDSVFNSGTLIDPVDLFTGDGTTDTFTLVNKSGTLVNNSIMVGNTLLYKSQGDFVVVGDDITFADPPVNEAIIIVPGLFNLMSGIIFDSTDVPGVTNPNEIELAFWVGDYVTPDLNSYVAAPGQAGVIISVVALNEDVDVTAEWTQLTQALPDGSADDYLDPAVALVTDDFSGEDALTAATVITDTTILVDDTTNFINGDYVKIGSGTSNVEIRQITDIPDGTTLTVAPLNNNHDLGETIFTSHRKFWLKIIVPEGATDGEAINLYNLAIQRIYVTVAK